MTHTLHRFGNPDSLRNDYILLAMSAKGFNDEGAAERLARIEKIIADHNPVNGGDMRTGNFFMKRRGIIFDETKDISIVHGVFSKVKDLEEALREIVKEDLGISVVVSGIFEETFATAKNAGCKCHTIQYSIGVFGKLERLPSSDVLEVTTMCGHHQISPKLVEKLVAEVKEGRLTPEAAAEQLAYPCVCGVFNPVRAARLIAKMAFK